MRAQPLPVLIRVYGDSLSLPRAADGITFRDTFAELLVDKLTTRFGLESVHVYNRSQGGATARRLATAYESDTSYFGAGDTQITVIQCGVVDCAPRPVPPRVRRLISRLPAALRRRIITFLHDNRARLLRRGAAWRETSPGEFRAVMHGFIAAAARDSTLVCVLNIAPTTEMIEAHSPGFAESIGQFNAILSEVVAAVSAQNVVLIDTYALIESSPDGIAALINPADGHHITRAAHELYAETLAEACASAILASSNASEMGLAL